MKSQLCLLAVLICLAGSLASTQAATSPPLNDAQAGQELAKQLRSLVPAENSALRGAFEFERSKAEEDFVPLTMSIVLTNDTWLTIYTARHASGTETLRILHRPEKSSVYMHELPAREARSLVGDLATNSFAGSDFALLDLGLEFFHWPTQVLLMRQMKKGRGCDVLESRPAKPAFYSRVVSWIDQESRGLLMAEAYDVNGKLLKEFEISKFDRSAGQVRELEIRNRQTKGSTRLRFETGAK